VIHREPGTGRPGRALRAFRTHRSRRAFRAPLPRRPRLPRVPLRAGNPLFSRIALRAFGAFRPLRAALTRVPLRPRRALDRADVVPLGAVPHPQVAVDEVRVADRVTAGRQILRGRQRPDDGDTGTGIALRPLRPRFPLGAFWSFGPALA